jgi:hypothetical protein
MTGKPPSESTAIEGATRKIKAVAIRTDLDHGARRIDNETWGSVY